MSGSYYLFALFIFALVTVLLLLYRQFVLKAKGRRTEQDEQSEEEKEKEQRLFRLYQNIEEMMDNFEAYVEDTREQMESVKGQIEQQADYINSLLQRVETAEAGARSAISVLHAPEGHQQERSSQHGADSEKQSGENGKRASKNDAVRELLSRGMTVEQIAQKLELSINEVRLIVYGLMKKNSVSK